MKFNKRIFIWMIVVAVAGALVWRIFILPEKESTAYSASGGPLDIKLIAIRPDMGRDCYDVNGSKIEDLPLGVLPADPKWHDGEYCMDFIFEIPKQADILLPYDSIVINAGENFLLQGSLDHWRIVELAGRKLLVANVRFEDSFFVSSFFYSGTEKYSRFDLELSYIFTSPSQQPVVFKGPFKPDTVVTGSNPMYELNIKGNKVGGGRIASAHFSGEGLFRAYAVYDKAGNRHRPIEIDRSIFIESQQSQYKYCVTGVPLSQIESIVCYNRRAIRWFNNISAELTGHERRCYAQYIDDMAKRLGVKGFRVNGIKSYNTDQIVRYRYKNFQEAIKILDVARGYALENACNKLFFDGFNIDKVDQRTRQFIRKSLLEAARSYYVRQFVICVGLKCGFDEFTDIAFDIMEGKNLQQYGERIRSGQALEIISQAFRGKRNILNDAQIARARKIALDTDNYYVRKAMFSSINNSFKRNEDAVLAVFKEFAEDDRIWFWWPGVHYYSRLNLIAFKAGVLPDKINKRFEIYQRLRGRSSNVEITNNLLTVDFAASCPENFGSVCWGILENLDRTEAIEYYITFLNNVKGKVQSDNFMNLNQSIQHMAGALKDMEVMESKGAKKMVSKHYWGNKDRPKDVKALENFIIDIIKKYEGQITLNP